MSSAESSAEDSAEGSAQTRLTFVSGESGRLSALLTAPRHPLALLVLAHGAGAGFEHPNMLAISEALKAEGVASLRFNFPFMEQGRRRVDSPAVAGQAIADAWAAAGDLRPELPRFLGGHSFGGRMASHAVRAHRIHPRGLVFCAFPLHPAGKPASDRAAHLRDLTFPMLFLSGTRDALANPELLTHCAAGLGSRATLHWLEDADHGYRVRKRVRGDGPSVFQEMACAIRHFMLAHI